MKLANFQKNVELYGRKVLGSSAEIKNPIPKRGWSVWIEKGTWYTAKKVNVKKFGEHVYGKNYTGACSCGCYMGDCSSWGPVDPFGACPNNPK